MRGVIARKAAPAIGRRKPARRAVFVGVLPVLFGLGTTAMADNDSGEHTFFQTELRHMQDTSVRRPPPAVARSYVPLTIRRSPDRYVVHDRARSDARSIAMTRRPEWHRVASAAPLTIHAAAPSASVPTGRVTSIFLDPTLRRGDVVIMAKGPRVFAGSQQFPYVEKDFVAIDRAPEINQDLRHAISAIAANPYQQL